MFSFSCSQFVIVHLNFLINIYTRADHKVPVNFHILKKALSFVLRFQLNFQVFSKKQNQNYKYFVFLKHL